LNKKVLVLTKDEKTKEFFSDIQGFDCLLVIDDFDNIISSMDKVKDKIVYVTDIQEYEKYNFDLKYFNLGKPNLLTDRIKGYDIMVGDSLECDFKFAQYNDLFFIHINPAKDSGVKYKNDIVYFSFHSVKDILNEDVK